MNDAVIFGDSFEHATKPDTKIDALRVMLSLTFGTDKIEHLGCVKTSDKWTT